MPISLIVHGGAWDIPADQVVAHQIGCRHALDAGWQVLQDGGSALDAVEAAIRVLEDDPAFDAGYGSVLNRDGVVELDAAVMDGQTLRVGGVAAVQRIRNPITLARRVLESQVCLLVSEGAERFAQSVGIDLCDPLDLIVERERERWELLRARNDIRAQESFTFPGHSGTIRPSDRERSQLTHPADTVGAVALDRYGHLAAGTSTGGTAHKLPGRVGDSPLFGCGLYADDEIGACSSTGWGESIIKVLLAKTAVDFIAQGSDPMMAAREAISLLADRVDGYGGCIMVDPQGWIGFAFNTPRMAYAYRTEEGHEFVGI